MQSVWRQHERRQNTANIYDIILEFVVFIGIILRSALHIFMKYRGQTQSLKIKNKNVK